MITVNIQQSGLPAYEAMLLQKCIDEYNLHHGKNLEKEMYYEGKIKLADVNLGIALPKGMSGLEVGCAWGAKSVDVLASRSMFDGFVGSSGAKIDDLAKIADSNRLVTEYAKACRDELKFGCAFAALSAEKDGCRIRFYSPKNAGALWDGEKGRIKCGFVIVDYNKEDPLRQPTLINFYTDVAVWVLSKNNSVWSAKAYPHEIGRPLMEPLVWNATSNKPFGRSRIKEPVRRLIQGYVRTIANAAIGLEFATSPQKYILGVTDDQFDAIVSDKFKQYVGAIIAATTNPDTGEKPTFGQLAQGNISPHVEMIRVLATQFSAATGIPITDVGVVNDANPTSADAIEGQTKTLVCLAQELNTCNGDALKQIALMALAISKNTTIEALPNEQKDIVAHFRNPSMPSVAATTDAALELASAREGFASTDVFLEMVGFSPADIRRIKAQETRARGMALIENLSLRSTPNGNQPENTEVTGGSAEGTV
jgi:hypothetical protein